MKRTLLIFLAVATLVIGGALVAQADTFDLANGNSTATIATNNQVYEGAGAVNWNVDNTFIMYQQQYFVGIGDAVANPNAGQISMGALPYTTSGNGTNFLEVDYTGTGYTAVATYVLHGGAAGTGTSDMSETFGVTNTSGQTQTFRIYVYTDFDLGSLAANDNASIANGPASATAIQTGVTHPEWQAVTTANPNATHVEANEFANTLLALLSGTSYTLNDVLAVQNVDATWALEYVVDIANDGSFLLSMDKRVSPVPLPGALMLLGAGLFRLAAYGRRRRNEVA